MKPHEGWVGQMRLLRIGVVGLLVPAALAGCVMGFGDTKPPSAETQAAEVARLQADVVPVVDELDVTFYLNEGKSCHGIVYRRGEFRDGDDSCGTPSEQYGRFDAQVRADFDRISAAIKRSEVNTYRFDALLTGDGALEKVTFPRTDSSWQWNWTYLYDPGNTVDKSKTQGEPTLSKPTYTKINDSWWLQTAVDD
jgi:hypothetical protein